MTNALTQYLASLYTELHGHDVEEMGGSVEFRAAQAAESCLGMAEDDLDQLIPKWYDMDLAQLTAAVEANDEVYDRLMGYLIYR